MRNGPASTGIRFGRSRVTPALHGAGAVSAGGPVIHSKVPPCNTEPYTAHGALKNNQTEEYVKEKWDVIHKRESERSIPLPDAELEEEAAGAQVCVTKREIREFPMGASSATMAIQESARQPRQPPGVISLLAQERSP